MKLLLDEMHAASIARALRADGVDAIAVTESPDLRGASDAVVLEQAADDGRVVVTENVPDFALLVGRWAAEGRSHAGVVFTSPVRFDRRSVAYPGHLIAALAAFAAHGDRALTDSVHWL